MADIASAPVVFLKAGDTCDAVRGWIALRSEGSAHQGFPVVDADGRLAGVVTRRDLLDPRATSTIAELVRRPPAVVFEDSSLREATDHMVREGVGRLPVVSRGDPGRVVGIVTRSDLIAVHVRRLDAERRREPRYRLGPRRSAARAAQADPVAPG